METNSTLLKSKAGILLQKFLPSFFFGLKQVPLVQKSQRFNATSKSRLRLFSSMLLLACGLASMNAFAQNVNVYSDQAETMLVSSHTTIQAAISDATTLDGYVVRVDAGIYDEVLLINKEISLLGANSAISAVNGTRVAETRLLQRIAINQLENVTVSGFEFFEVPTTTTWTIYIQGNSNNFTFENNRFIDLTTDAIRSGITSSTANITVTGNLIDGINNSSSTGIFLGGISGTSVISDNKIDLKNTGYCGIQTPSATGLTISGNEISNTTNQGLQLAGTCGNVVITNNNIFNANTSGGADKGAIRMYGAGFTGSISITNNILANSFNGVAVRNGEDISGKDILIQNNDLSGNSNFAIYNGASAGTIEAPCNWYGTAVAADIPAKISGQVNYTPYLNNGTDDAPTAAGFQPVPGSCSGCIGGGSVTNTTTGNTYCSIQEAINDPATLDGHTITLEAGIYDESVLVTKQISLLGPNSAISAVNGSRVPEARLLQSLRINEVANVTVSGLEFFEVTSTTWTIYIQGNSDNFTFKNNRFIDIQSDAIRSGNTSSTGNITVMGNLIDGITTISSTGFSLGGISGTSVIADNKIDLAYAGSPTGYAGIQVPSATGLTISGNEISNTTNQGIQLAGICGNVIIENNNIFNTNTSNGADKGAIRLYGSAFTGPITIRGNFLSNSFNGVAVKNGEDITGKDILIQNNDLSGNSNFAIYNGASAGTIEAPCNWYGTAVLADIPAEISGQVNFVLYLNDGTDNAPTTTGFQPVPGSCTGCVSSSVTNTNTGNTYCTIQAAIDAATAGDEINIAAGDYTEQLEIDKDITLQGSGIGITNIFGFDNMPISFVSFNSNTPIVYIHDGANVQLSGLTINGDGLGDTNDGYSGIGIQNASGNFDGIEVKGVTNTTPNISQNGVGISANNDDGTPRTLVVTNSNIADNQKNAIAIIGDDLTAEIESNTISGAVAPSVYGQIGILIQYGATGYIKNNSITDFPNPGNNMAAVGITLDGSSDTVDIENNIMTDCQLGIQIRDGSAKIVSNDIIATGYGVYIWASIASIDLEINNNTINNPVYGIYFFTTYGAITATANENSIRATYRYIDHIGSSTNIDATCNWYGISDAVEVGHRINGAVTYLPLLLSGSENNPAATGFDPSGPCASPYASFVLTPSTTSVGECDEFTVLVSVATTGPLNVAEAHYYFDPAELEVVSINAPGGGSLPISNLPSEAVPATFNNTIGTFSYAAFATAAEPVPSSNFDFFEVTFKALGSSGTTYIKPKLAPNFPKTLIAYTDNSGSMAIAYSVLSDVDTVTVNLGPDVTAPTAICQDLTINLDATGNATINANDIDNGSFDACGTVSLAIDQSTFNCSDIGVPLANDLFISEYVEGSSNNKYIEIFNGTGSPVDLSDYELRTYSNGGSTALYSNNLGVAGTLQHGDVAVFSNSQANEYSGVNYSLSSIAFNGDDAVELYNVALGQSADIFGEIGDDPGSAWNSGSHTTKDATLVRKSNVTQGVTINPSGFPTLTTEWDVFGNDEVSNLGSHTIITGGSSPVVTLTVTDSNGNTSNCTATVTVLDNLAPTAICKDFTVSLDASGNATITASDIDNGSSDACSIASMEIDNSAFTCADLGESTVTLTVTDVNGNSSTCTSTVTVIDDISPVVTCVNITAQLDASGNVTISADDLDGGSTDNCGIVSLGILGCSGNLIYDQNVTPELINGDGITNGGFTIDIENGIELGLRAKVTYPSTQNIFNSNGDGSYNHIVGSFGSGGVQASWNFGWSINTDQAGTSGQKLADLTYELGIDYDKTDGVDFVTFDPINIPFGDHAIGDNTTGNGGGAVASDNTEYASFIAANNVAQNSWRNNFFGAFDGTQDGRYDIYLKAFNSDGDVVAQTAITVIAGAGTGNAYAGCLTPLESIEFDCADVGANNVTLVAYDAAGNSSSCAATITVEDNVAPVAICQDIDIYVDANGDASIVAADIDGGSTDNCGPVTVSASQLNFSCADVSAESPEPTFALVISGILDGPLSGGKPKSVELYVAQDIADLSIYGFGIAPNGNTSISQSFALSGSASAGTYLYISDEAFGFNSFFGFNPDFTDNAVSFNGDDVIALFENGTVIDAFGELGVDGTGEAWEYLDGWAYRMNGVEPNAGSFNVANWSYSGINALDNETTNASADTPFPIASYSTGGSSGTDVVLTVTDANGNSSTCTAAVTVLDTIAPLTICQNITVQLDGSGQVTITEAQIDNNSSDNCTITSLSLSQTIFDCSNVGPNSVTLTVTDASGNSSTCTATVTVEDNEAPIITLLGDAVVELCAGQPYTDAGVTASDNCGGDLTGSVVTVNPVDVNTPGTYTVTYNVSDGTPNAAVEVSRTVTVQPKPIVEYSVDGSGFADIDMVSGANYSLTVCSGDTLTNSIPSTTSLNPAACGDLRIQTQFISNLPNIASATLDASFAQSVVAGAQKISPTNPTGTAKTITFITTAYYDADGSGSLTAGDVLGDEITFVLTVEPTPSVSNTVSSPAFADINMTSGGNYDATICSGEELTTTAPSTLQDDPSTCGPLRIQSEYISTLPNIASATLDASYADAVLAGSQTISPTNTTGSVQTITFITTPYYDVDGSGSLTAGDVQGEQITFVLTVESVLGITCPADISVSTDSGLCSASVAFAATAVGTPAPVIAYSIDDPNNPGNLLMIASGYSFPAGNTVVTSTVSSSCGSEFCTFNVTVTDNENPTIACATPTASYSSDLGVCDYTVTGTDLDPTATSDNCTIASVKNDYNNSASLQNAVFPLGTSTVVWTITDGVGNTVTCQYDVVVEDNENPVITCASDDSRFANQTNNSYLVSGTAFDATASDNCTLATLTHNAASIAGAVAGADNMSLDGWELPAGVNTVTFTATDASGNTETCDVVITVEGNTLSGTVAVNLACTPIDIRVLLFDAGTPNMVGSFIATIDVNGNFSVALTGVVPGNYDVFFKAERYLQQGYLNQTIGSSNVYALSGLRPGDISGAPDQFNDNLINSLDLSLMISNYNTINTDPNFNERCDLNCDGQVDGLDLSLLIFFYLQQGDNPTN